MIKTDITRFIFCGILISKPVVAFAYIGPGMGLGAFLVTFALIIGIVFLLLSLIWFPLKRKFLSMFKKNKKNL